MRSPVRLVAAVAVVILVAGGSVLGLAAPAQAHNFLVSSSPAADSTLTSLPEQFSVTTSETLLDLAGNGSGFALQVLDEEGLFYGDGCIVVEGASIYTTPAIGTPGTYTLRWQVVSGDGHAVSDSFTFEWAPAPGDEGADGAAAEGSAAAPACGATSDGATEPDDAATAPSASPAAAPDVTDLLWIGGAAVAVAAAVGIALLVVRRPRR